ncbi:T9SS type A sorting domain-containing protein [Flavobacterium sp.]|uniref:T9SS type A sorting domain-containing protein n=1 Tax=Flavobacterium sp. TaxID=239 RepID=UPI0025BB1D8C|nr:T9SS type A sorting domain-containing protein [Flavobacterium sp.]
MAKNLLFLFFGLLVTLSVSGQAVANPVPDLTQCGSDTFDLTPTAAITLNGLSPNVYSVQWHFTQADANSGMNPIANPSAFTATDAQTIWVRVTTINTGQFDTTSFQLHITGTLLTPMPDVIACDYYALPALPSGAYYSQPGGQGQPIPLGNLITASQTVWIYAPGNDCPSEESFLVTIIATPVAPQMPDVVVCDNYILPALSSNANYFMLPDGLGNVVSAGTAITETTTLYIHAQNGNCSDESSFTITIIENSDFNVQDVSSCAPYELPILPIGWQYQYFQGAAPIAAGTIIYETKTIYVSGGNCGGVSPMTITIGDIALQNNVVEACKTGNSVTFDFTDFYTSISANNANVITSIYLTMADALAQSQQLPTIFTTVIDYQIVAYARIENLETGCFSIELIVLKGMSCTNSSISGTVSFDADGNGCDASDANLSGIEIACLNANTAIYAYTNTQGEFEFADVYAGSNYVYVVQSSLPNGATLTTDSQEFQVTGNNQNFTADFCVADAQNTVDTGVVITSESAAIPGFAAYYALIVENHNALPSSGSLTLTYDENLLDFSGSTPSPTAQSAGSLTFNFSNVPAFGLTTIPVNFVVSTPPTAQMGDILNFTATVSVANDTNLTNNTSGLFQTIVNSYDPNDITCHEGDLITPDQADGYLHYTIRFQNMGTAAAQIVRIENQLSNLLDWSTFRPIASSHNYLANRNGNQVSFTFNNINLPAEQDDEAGSNGYIVYEIKPIAGAQIGDTIENTAEIYFDFNAAVVTNTALTTIQLLSTPENSANAFVVYPNPASGRFSVKAQNVSEIDMEIADVRGATVFAKKLSLVQDEVSVDISGLTSGLYFVRMASEKGSAIRKLIIR